jgi:DNA-binding MarR family transcriptional regulator
MRMTRGVSRRETTEQRVFAFLKDKDEVGFEQIAEFCGKGSIYRNTVKKYLDEMKKAGYVKQSPDGRHPYILTPKGQEKVRTLIDERNMLEDFESKRRMEFQLALIWLQEFEYDHDDFADMLKYGIDTGKISKSDLELLIEWGEERLVKEYKKALGQLKKAYSELKYHLVIKWTDEEDIDADKREIDSHEFIINEMQALLPVMKRLLESDGLKDRKIRERLFEEFKFFPYKDYFVKIAGELAKMKDLEKG